MSNYPTSLDVLTPVTNTPNVPPIAAPLNALRQAVVATETVVGYGDRAPYIMYIGDSLTEGAGNAAVTQVPGGYREKLYQLALTNGVTLRSLGAIATNPAPGMAYPNHAGYTGQDTASMLSTHIPAQANTPAPAYVVLDIGNNDIKNNTNLGTFNSRYGSIINLIATKWFGVKMILLTLGQYLDNANGSYAYMMPDAVNPNAYIRGLDTSGIYSTSIAVIDMAQILTGDGATNGPPGMLGDGLHPNAWGYQKMAEAIWYGALSRII